MDTARIQRLRDLADQALGYSARLAHAPDAADLLHLLERAERMAAFPADERDAAQVQPMLDMLLDELPELRRRATPLAPAWADVLRDRAQAIVDDDDREDVIEWGRDLLALANLPDVELTPLIALIEAHPDRFLVLPQIAADRVDVESPNDAHGLLRLFAETPIATLRAEAPHALAPDPERLARALSRGAARLGISESAWRHMLDEADDALRPHRVIPFDEGRRARAPRHAPDEGGTVVWLPGPIALTRMAADTPHRLPPVDAWSVAHEGDGLAINLSAEERDEGVILWIEIVRLRPSLPPLDQEGIVSLHTTEGAPAHLGRPKATADSWLARLADVDTVLIGVGAWRHTLKLQRGDD